MYEERFMRQALALSAQALDTPGTEPFGAVVVRGGVVVGEGFNHSAAHHDPTSHGEVEAIRDACRKQGSVLLTGCELYTSCEPCALCMAAMRIVGIAKVYYAASLDQSGTAFAGLSAQARPDIDVEDLRAVAAAPLARSAIASEQHEDAQAVRILQTWADARR